MVFTLLQVFPYHIEHKALLLKHHHTHMHSTEDSYKRTINELHINKEMLLKDVKRRMLRKQNQDKIEAVVAPLPLPAAPALPLMRADTPAEPIRNKTKNNVLIYCLFRIR
jgi:hypothetical protein